MRVLGLNSGTSLDGIDAALLTIEVRDATMRLSRISWFASPWPAGLQAELRRLADPTVSVSLRELALASVAAGDAFADVASTAVRTAGLTLGEVDLIASHGQTVHHAVDDDGRALASLQIGEPAVIAERTGRTVVADFRPRDIAAGGQGAPLVGFLDALLFAEQDRPVAALNIGGIANVTLIPAGAALDAVAWDTGPGNTLIDGLARRLIGRPCDVDGAVAGRGTVDTRLLDELLEHPYYARRPPKSTGRELFGDAAAAAIAERGRASGATAEDLLATVTELTARTIARGIRDAGGPWPAVLHVAGGGARNPTLLRALTVELEGHAPGGAGPPEVRMTDASGIAGDAKEAICFAVLGHEALHGRPNSLPRATGARHASVLGAIWPGDGYVGLSEVVTEGRRREPSVRRIAVADHGSVRDAENGRSR